MGLILISFLVTALLTNDVSRASELTPGTPPCDIVISSLYQLLEQLQKPIIIKPSD